MAPGGKPRAAPVAPEIRAYYESTEERTRLLSGGSAVEFERSKDVLLRNLPEPPATILDVGGAAGAYSLWLAGLGYRTVLVDLMPIHVRQAQDASRRQPARPMAGVVRGDARRLPFDEETVDGVLLFGPLYHLTRVAEREAALSEAFRVLKEGGLVAAAGISRFTSLLDGSFRGYVEDPQFVEILARDLRKGQHRNPSNRPEYFTTAFFHHPRELETEVRAAGFREVTLFGLEGYAWLLPNLDEVWKDPTRRAALLDRLRAIETEDTLVGASGHLLCLGRKRAGRLLPRAGRPRRTPSARSSHRSRSRANRRQP